MESENVERDVVIPIHTTESKFDGLIIEETVVQEEKVKKILELKKARFIKNEWMIPGRREAREDCGTVHHVVKCKDTGAVIFKRHWCMRRECPVCYTAWAGREASRIQQRLRVASFMLKIENWYHWSFSFDEKIAVTPANIKKYEKEVRKYFPDGVMVFHPYRYKIVESGGPKRWEYSPHWHIVSSQRFVDTKNLNEEIDEWNQQHKRKKLNFVAKNIRRVNDNEMNDLFSYELGHAGFEDGKKNHVVRYFGRISYNKLSAEKVKVELPVLCSCSDCKTKPDKLKSFVDEWEYELVEEKRDNIEGTYRIITEIELKNVLGRYETKREILYPKLDVWNFNDRLWEFFRLYYPEILVKRIMGKIEDPLG